jgi:SAM-dependent methyltransferase
MARTVKLPYDQALKWNYDHWNSFGIELQGSHSFHMWAQALTHLSSVYGILEWKTMADIGCGFPPLDLQKIPTFAGVETIIRADGSERVKAHLPDVRVANFNKEPLPLQDNEVDFAISFEVIEHMFSTYGFLSELARISKYGFMISKPNTDYDGLNSHWYGEKYFFDTGTPLFDGEVRFEHINFIPNYELFGFAKVLGYEVTLLDQSDEEMQFFLFVKKELIE